MWSKILPSVVLQRPHPRTRSYSPKICAELHLTPAEAPWNQSGQLKQAECGPTQLLQGCCSGLWWANLQKLHPTKCWPPSTSQLWEDQPCTNQWKTPSTWLPAKQVIALRAGLASWSQWNMRINLENKREVFHKAHNFGSRRYSCLLKESIR